MKTSIPKEAKMVKIAVLGAGINGVASALKVKEKYPNNEVVIISNIFTPGTTGDGSGGLWYPFLCGNTPGHLLKRWGGETYHYLHRHWLRGGLGISLLPLYYLFKSDQGGSASPDWKDTVFGYQDLGERELEYLRELFSVSYVAGHTFTTFIVPPPKMISHLFQRFLSLGGQVRVAEVRSLQDPLLEGFEVVVNCTGLGARSVVPDGRVYPIRGQVFRVKAPWINHAILEDSGHYILPNDETVVVGGTHQEHDFNTELDPKDTEYILDGCRNIIPSLTKVKPVAGWVGLRPGRDEVRIESELKYGKLVIHNYGHGGSGLTLFWGCATEVLNLLEKHLPPENEEQYALSKL